MIVDSCADYHIVGNRDLLLDMEGCSKKLITAKGEDLGVTGVGTLSMCLGYYTDVAGEQQALDVQFKNVYYAPECAFNLLSLNRLNEENINLNTGIKSLIFPAPEDMMIPSGREPIFYEYESWTMHQTKDHMGYPAFRAQYKCGKNITLTGWLNKSGLKWEAQNNILALKDHPTNETNLGIRSEFNNISPDMEFPIQRSCGI